MGFIKVKRELTNEEQLRYQAWLDHVIKVDIFLIVFFLFQILISIILVILGVL